MDSAGEAALALRARSSSCTPIPTAARPAATAWKSSGVQFKLVPAPGTSQDVAMLIAAEKGARLIVSVGSQFNLVEFLDRNRKGMSSTFLTRLRIGEILVDAKGVSRLYQPRPGLTPLLVVIAAGLVAMIAVVWMTPALRDVVELLWLKLQLLLGAAEPRRAAAPTHVRLSLPRALSRRRPARARGRRASSAWRSATPNLVSSAKSGIVHDLNSEVSGAQSRRAAARAAGRRGSVRQRPLSARGPRAAQRAQRRAGVPRRLLRTGQQPRAQRRHAGRRQTSTTVVAVREPLDLRGSPTEAAGTHYAALGPARRRTLVEPFGELVGKQLVSGGQLVDRELLSRVRDRLLSAFDGQLGRLEGLVVMRADPTDMTPEQSRASAAFESGLIDGVAAVGVPAVGVELTSTEPSQVPWYRARDISSVDNLDATAGQAALVYALAGSHGAYGTKSTADSLLPSVGARAPSRRPSTAGAGKRP